MKILPKFPTCSQCKFFDPSFKSAHYPASYGLCRNPRKAYRDYMGDGSSASVQPIMSQNAQACGCYAAIGQMPIPLEDDNLIRHMAQEG